MKIIEIVLLFITVLLTVTKLFNFNINEIWLTTTFSLLSFYYMSFSFFLFNKLSVHKTLISSNENKVSITKALLTILMGFALSITTIGILFVLQYWQGVTFILNIGLICLTLTTFLILIKYFRSNFEFCKSILRRVILIGGVGIILNFFPSNFHEKTGQNTFPIEKSGQAGTSNTDCKSRVVKGFRNSVNKAQQESVLFNHLTTE